MATGTAPVNCDVIKEEYAGVKWRLDAGVLSAATRASDRTIVEFYGEECWSDVMKANVPGDNNARYRLNDEVRVKFMLAGVLPVDCEILRHENQMARTNLEAVPFIGYGHMTSDEREYYTAVASFYKSGACR